MDHTFYDGTVVVLQGILNSLSHVLHKGQDFSPATDFLKARLHENMYPLADQVRIAVQFSERLIARLTNREPTIFDGSPATFAECYERIDVVVKALNEADKAVVNQRMGIAEMTEMGPEQKANMSNAVYAHVVVLPNVYFHLVTAYDILRKEGVPLSKRDYYTGFFPALATV